MKVVILCTSDNNGGAAIVSHRLMTCLNAEGIDAKMVVAKKGTGDNLVSATNNGYKKAFYTERLKIFLSNGFNKKDLFKVSTASDGAKVLSHPWLKEADIVCLSWINQGFLSLKGLDQLCKSGKKIVWTMHDMWCCTGICHHAYNCKNYKNTCGNCKFVRFKSEGDISHKVWNKKRRLYKSSDINFVAVSSWLERRCIESSLLADQNVTVIPNALPVSDFQYKKESNTKKTRIIMGAARLDEAVKGFELLIEAANYISDNHHDEAKNLELMLFGNIRNAELLKKIRLPYKYIGSVDPTEINNIYRSGDIVVSSSHFETLPTTLIEGLASGCLAVAFAHGGQADIITHKGNGYLAKYPDATDLAEGIIWATEQKVSREILHNEMAEKFDGPQIAKKYIELFKSL